MLFFRVDKNTFTKKSLNTTKYFAQLPIYCAKVPVDKTKDFMMLNLFPF